MTLIGFGATLFGVFRSFSAAKGAQRAAHEALRAVRRLDTILDVSSAIALMEEIKRLHRQKAWQILPDKYASLRKILNAVKASGLQLTDEQSSTVQNAITNLRTMERKVETALADNSQLTHVKFNAAISDDIDRLIVVITQIKIVEDE